VLYNNNNNQVAAIYGAVIKTTATAKVPSVHLTNEDLTPGGHQTSK